MAYRQPWSLVGPKHNDQYTGGHTGVTTEDVVRAVLPAEHLSVLAPIWEHTRVMICD